MINDNLNAVYIPLFFIPYFRKEFYMVNIFIGGGVNEYFHR